MNAWHPNVVPVRKFSPSVFPLSPVLATEDAVRVRHGPASRPFLVKGAHTAPPPHSPPHQHILFGPHRVLKIGKLLPTNPDLWFSLEEPEEQATLGPHPTAAVRWGGADAAPFSWAHGSSLPQSPPLPAALPLASPTAPSWPET